MKKQTIPVVGMACSACSANVELKLNSLPGVTSASVSLPARTALIEYDESQVSLAEIKQEINAIGYDLIIESGRSAEQIERNEYLLLRRKTIFSWIFVVSKSNFFATSSSTAFDNSGYFSWCNSSI